MHPRAKERDRSVTDIIHDAWCRASEVGAKEDSKSPSRFQSYLAPSCFENDAQKEGTAHSNRLAECSARAVEKGIIRHTMIFHWSNIKSTVQKLCWIKTEESKMTFVRRHDPPCHRKVAYYHGQHYVQLTRNETHFNGFMIARQILCWRTTGEMWG